MGLFGCLELPDLLSSSGELFVCTDQHGASAELCWNGSTAELSIETTWSCRRTPELVPRLFGCAYKCPTSADDEWWSWCPADQP